MDIKNLDSTMNRNKDEELDDISIDENTQRFFKKTVAFQGQLQLYMVKEKANQVKE